MLAAVSVWMAHRSSCEQRVEVVELEAFVVVGVLSSISVGRSVGSAGVSAWGGVRLVVVKREVGRCAAGVQEGGGLFGLLPDSL